MDEQKASNANPEQPQAETPEEASAPAEQAVTDAAEEPSSQAAEAQSGNGQQAADTTKAPDATAAADSAEAGDVDAADAGPASASAAEPAEPTLEDKLQEAEKTALTMRDKMLRVAADFDNFRKRSHRDADEANKRGKKSVVMELLPVFDNLERALSHGDESTDSKSMVDGLRMVHKQFIASLSKLGMERVEALGEVFDPTLHDSIQHLHSEEYETGRVMAVLQPGYRMGETLVRPAMVVVSKGPAEVVEQKADAAPEASDSAPDAEAAAEPAAEADAAEPTAESAPQTTETAAEEATDEAADGSAD